ncbi:ATP-binding protein [Desulfothermus naphthae]
MKKVAFIDREKEFKFLANWIESEPNAILFLYGPKSGGKTTLIYKFIESLDKEKYEIKDFNLRKYVISNYRDFLSVFFGIDFSKSKEDVKEKRQYNLRIFKLDIETYKGLQNLEYDAFEIMEKELLKIRQQGKKPIILIDELQALEDIYINGKRELIKEVFNFFIAMTKESHLCHVIVASSDGYFIEKIYTYSKLSKTSELLEIDYLGKEDVFYWLSNIDKENNIHDYKLTHDQINLIWDKLGGSIWEIDSILFRLKLKANKGYVNTEDIETELNKIIHANFVKIVEYRKLYYKKELFLQIAKLFKQKGYFVYQDVEESFDDIKLMDELGNLVRLNYLYYNPVTGEYKPQGRSFYWAYIKYGEEFDNKA